MSAKHLLAVVMLLAAAALASLQFNQPLVLSQQWSLIG